VSRLAPPFLLAVVLSSCACDGPAPPDAGAPDAGEPDAGEPVLTGRCDIDLSPFFSHADAGAARAVQISSEAELLGGPNAQGVVGDFRLENEKIRVVVQGRGRVFGPHPWGGTIIDADLAGPGAGNDQLGELGLLYNFGRALKPDQYEVLADGADGGAAVVAVSGVDEANDYLSIRNKLAEALGRVPFADPYVAVPLRLTNYFVLNPGEQRVRYLTAFCSQDRRNFHALAVGDLVDPGYVLEFFNPQACTDGFGFGGTCFSLDRMPWFGYQGQGVAYGYAPYKAGSPLLPEAQNATLSVAGITGTIIGANGLLGLGSWVQESRDVPRDGEIRLPPLGFAVVARDVWVAKDLGELSTLIETSRATTALAEVTGTVQRDGQPLADARVVFEGSGSRAAFFTGADGTFRARLPARTWQVSAWKEGHRPTAKQAVTTSAATPATVALSLQAPRRLTVTVREANGGPMPAKVTVLCASGPCAVPHRQLVLYTDVTKDPLPDNVALVGWVGPSGTASFELPADQYVVLVSRGPEYSVHPIAFPTVPGEAVDLRAADATVNAVLARVLDTAGWMSADFHVHAVNSPDSIVDNARRALTFAGDGVEVLVGTDHDVVTDFAPAIAAAGLSPFVASVVGEEASPLEWGHYNLFPLSLDATNRINGGALDWGGGEGPTLSAAELFAEGRRLGAKTVHVNHPRGSLGGFTALKLDTDTWATHLDPAVLRMAPQPGATASDTKLLSTDFDAMEILNPGDDGYDGTSPAARARFNDWFTLLSRGFRVAATGVSDTHYANLATGWRTWVELGVDEPAQLDPAQLSARLNAGRAVVSNGPFVSVTAYRVDAAGARVTTPVPIGGVVPPDARELGVTVEVQVPPYLDVTKVELYLHTPADDGACPVDPASAIARTTRVACDGVSNANWPSSSIAASQAVALGPSDFETVTTDGALVFRRARKQVHFRLPAPTRDNWVVAMVYGSRSLAPLLIPYPGVSGTAAPFAFTNPIYVDADGNGYDKPPFTRPRLGAIPLPSETKPPPSTDPDDIARRWGEQFHAH
jgi:hypothetical protein